MSSPTDKGSYAIWNDYLSTMSAKLAPLPDIEEMTTRVVRIMGGNPALMRLQGTNTYIIGTGTSRILIDTAQGLSCWSENVFRYLEAQNIDISHVLLTHHHDDHIGGVPDLIAHDAKYTSRIYKHRPQSFHDSIEPGQIFAVEGATLRALFTPGHSFDHMCFVLEEENAIFTGDHILGQGHTVIENFGDYLRSLQLVKDQHCVAGYPGHGPKIQDMSAKVEDCIKHRLHRENQVYRVLANNKKKLINSGSSDKGGMNIRELIHSIHGDVSTEIVTVAMEPLFTKILWKLAAEHKIGFIASGGDRKWFANTRSPSFGPSTSSIGAK